MKRAEVCYEEGRFLWAAKPVSDVLARRIASPITRSSWRVTLMLSILPLTMETRCPTRSTKNASSVASTQACRLDRCASRSNSILKACGVWGQPEPLPIKGRFDHPVRSRPLHRIMEGNRHDSRTMGPGPINHAFDHCVRHERPYGIMDQHDLGTRVDCLQPVPHRILSPCSASDDFADFGKGKSRQEFF